MNKEQREYEKIYDDCVYISYVRLTGRPDPRDFRDQLRKVFCAIHKRKLIKDIPKETKIKLKFGQEYNVIFENKEFVKKDIIFDPKMFTYMKNIENQNFDGFNND